LRLKIFKKLRTASLNSEFTGSYKKKCIGGARKVFHICETINLREFGDQQEEPYAQLGKLKQYSNSLRMVNGKKVITIKFLSLSWGPLSTQLAYLLALCQTPFSKRKENKNTVLIATIVGF